METYNWVGCYCTSKYKTDMNWISQRLNRLNYGYKSIIKGWKFTAPIVRIVSSIADDSSSGAHYIIFSSI